MARRDIYARLDTWRAVRWDGPAYRHSAAALPASALSGEAARTYGGRWNPRGSFPTVYTSTDQETVVAEFLRSIGPERDLDTLSRKRILWTLDVHVDQLVDLRSAEHLLALGLPERFSPDVDVSRCQELGDAAHYVGYKGLIVPSVARPDGVNLVLFVDRLSAEDTLAVAPGGNRGRIADHLPAANP